MYKIISSDLELDFHVEKDQTILQAARQQQIKLPFGCGNGTCGSCKVKLEQGEINYINDYQPSPLSKYETEQGMILCCMAEPKDDLLITIPKYSDYPEIPIKTFQATVLSKTRLTDNIYQLKMQVSGDELFLFYPGQYLQIILSQEQKRAFSLANQHNQDNIIELQISYQANGLFSEQLKNEITEGSTISFSGAYGNFLLQQQFKQDLIFVAGGTGIVPIKAMLEAYLKEVPEHIRVHLYWGVHTAAQLYLQDQLWQWQNQYPNFIYTPVVSATEHNWKGSTGLVHEQIIKDYESLQSRQLYIAGPPPMIKKCQDVFPAFKASEDNIFFDAFESPIYDNSKSVEFRGIWKRLFNR